MHYRADSREYTKIEERVMGTSNKELIKGDNGGYRGSWVAHSNDFFF